MAGSRTGPSRAESEMDRAERQVRSQRFMDDDDVDVKLTRTKTKTKLTHESLLGIHIKAVLLAVRGVLKGV